MKLQPANLTLILALFSVCGTLQAQSGSELIDTYCLDCHNFNDWAGSLALDSLDAIHPEEAAESWEQVIRKLRSGMMPPPGEKRPSYDKALSLAETLEQRIDSAASIASQPPALHRLNRTEYQNAIRDLLGVETDISALLPLDNASEGFDNVASGLGSSPALIQGYASAADKLSRLAVGDMNAGESTTTYAASPVLRHNSYQDGFPLGTRGGMKVTHHFPVDAEYVFSVKGRASAFGSTSSARFDITLDGTALEPESTRNFRLAIPAGDHTLTMALVDETRIADVNNIYAEYSLAGSIDGLEITGPFNATGPGQTLSRDRIFSCYPQNNDEETACARSILGNLASTAFRESVTEQALEPAMQFYHRGYNEGGFETGIQQGIARILIDPRFIFRFEQEPNGLAPGTAYAVSDNELASRLAFFLWSSLPDAELIELAESGQLHKPEVLKQQARRMLADPKANALIENFTGQWLRLRELESLTPEHEDFSENLRQAFIKETRLLVTDVITSNKPVTDLLDADYTWVNERLATHYGIEGVYGDYFRPVPLSEDSHRRGLLGHASLLTVTSTATRTSPVIRGSWILENLLHAPVPAPPPGVETNLDGDGSVELTTSVRQRLEAHRENPSCNACHGVIDPVGFALENFDMIGAWREKDGDTPVDASGILADGTPVSSPADLRNALMKKPELFISTFTEKLLTYALGRKPEYYDMPELRAIVSKTEADDYRFLALVDAILSSPLFLERTATGSIQSLATTDTGRN